MRLRLGFAPLACVYALGCGKTVSRNHVNEVHVRVIDLAAGENDLCIF